MAGLAVTNRQILEAVRHVTDSMGRSSSWDANSRSANHSKNIAFSLVISSFQVFRPEFWMYLLFLNSCYMPRLSHTPWLIIRILSICCEYPQTLAHLFHLCSFVKRRVVPIWSRNSLCLCKALCFNFLLCVTIRRDVKHCVRKLMVRFRDPLSPDTRNKSFWLLFIITLL